MASSSELDAKMAHVNLMTDTIVANMPEDGLRAVLRSMLAVDPAITKTFEERARIYLTKQAKSPSQKMFTNDGEQTTVTPSFHEQQGRIRTMLGCGLCFESIPLLANIVEQVSDLEISSGQNEIMGRELASIDGDIIQALTAVQKLLLVPSGSRRLNDSEIVPVSQLHQALVQGQGQLSPNDDYPFARSLLALQLSQLLPEASKQDTPASDSRRITVSPLPETIETFTINGCTLPRLFSGLWQLSSPSWGIATLSQINAQFHEYSSLGFTAYDMADHYGDAEILFGRFRSKCTNPDALFGATKYCVFTPIQVTAEVISANITERCRRMQASYIDLLQFHWQDYNDPNYLLAMQYLQSDSRVHALGLCNFDTKHMLHAIESGIKIHTNQVQFSLIDSRPLHSMVPACKTHGVKLLTYGTLLGGFLSSTWLDKLEPLDNFSQSITPSQRKYYEMIVNWGGWELFQELLHVLQGVGAKYDRSVSCVAMKWVLDVADEVVGAVIVGTRWGVSGHAEENLKVYGWRLDEKDMDKIEGVLSRSRRGKMVELLGDCGGEYR
ncbi:hypothetical protein CKM354_001212900 [Cercospora kikuchii]|uniref:NADP-dependent oxidoreductase domain-containing protein n=1 Tax=Cercospora kikuchii TaxID=84275 RepID=A0A9P3CQT6_9PEZI|nr:uncharacterized protein CKM354_001212900 [Cercospora kikuchii]GIZ49089.1 hypothetical protein CKM354_001212900 [Cercospora kikuchii]